MQYRESVKALASLGAGIPRNREPRKKIICAGPSPVNGVPPHPSDNCKAYTGVDCETCGPLACRDFWLEPMAATQLPVATNVERREDPSCEPQKLHRRETARLLL